MVLHWGYSFANLIAPHTAPPAEPPENNPSLRVSSRAVMKHSLSVTW